MQVINEKVCIFDSLVDSLLCLAIQVALAVEIDGIVNIAVRVSMNGYRKIQNVFLLSIYGRLTFSLWRACPPNCAPLSVKFRMSRCCFAVLLCCL